ncbi:GTP-binding protein [Alcaligenaceae bacterium A4P071]|nr:GTP-binding protein [Alcaligenaceae bacterium C4P045]MDQ2183858.1 GTP-binding protein [Alcaligenaceae bacterium A4P071]
MSVELIILCGFLGSGKTSLLVDYLRADTEGATGVIVNEVGEVGVDGVIVADGSDNLPMTLLANGCVCCSLRSDLVYTINTLLDAPRPEGRPPIRRIILETSGVSRPGPIIASLADPDLIARRLRLTVVSTYDCTRGPSIDDAFEEAAAQLTAAHRIVLTKVDEVSEAALAEAAGRARAFNPLADVVVEQDRTTAVKGAFADDAGAGKSSADLALQALQSGAAAALRHPRISVFAAHPTAPLVWTDFTEWLDNIAGLCGDRMLRVKAVVRVTDCPDPILIQSVGTTFSGPQRLTRQPDAQPVVIVIVRDMVAADFDDAPHALLQLRA